MFPVLPALVAVAVVVVVVAEEEVLVWFVEEAEAEEYDVCCHVEAPALKMTPTSCNKPESSSRDKMLSGATVGSSSDIVEFVGEVFRWADVAQFLRPQLLESL
jgi:hypothetical protein